MIQMKLIKQRIVLSMAVVFIAAQSSIGGITVKGTQAQRNKLASWLTMSLGTTVTVNEKGKLSVGEGGNASATRLRNMSKDVGVNVTLELVEGNDKILFGRWNSEDPDDKYGKTTGTQTIDMEDLEAIGNVRNSYGLTPDRSLMHEITEVYMGKKYYDDCWACIKAHNYGGLVAEKELMGEHGTEMVERFKHEGNNRYLHKIKRPDGSFVVVRIDPGEWFLDKNKNDKWDEGEILIDRNGNGKYDPPEDLVEWLREEVPCYTIGTLIHMADPDPQVHIMEYDLDGNLTIMATWDTVNSMPTGVACSPSGHLYVTEDLPGQDEIRVFDPNGELIDTILGVELVDPEGIDVDQLTGHVFVAVDGRVIRYDSQWNLLGWYAISDPDFDPTDVAVWRDNDSGIHGVYGWGDIYGIFVSDRATSQVYRFGVEEHMNTYGFSISFGAGQLDSPEGLTVGPYGAVWVASTGNNRIYRFNPTKGTLIAQDGQDYFVEDSNRNFFDLVAIDSDGIYVVDETPQQGAVVLYNFQGDFMTTFGEGEVQCPRSIAVQITVNSDNLVPLGDFDAPFTIVDDFEDYDANDNKIWCIWHDGIGYGTPDDPRYFAGNWTGSAVGDETTNSTTEETIVHGGSQSMPVRYDNNKQGYAYYSEVERTLTDLRDWTVQGISELSLWFHGDPANDPEPLYVVISNIAGTPAMVVHDNPATTTINTWTEWVIPLQAFADQGIDLTIVDRIAIGFGTKGNITVPGGKGKMYFDDIRLYPPR